MQDRASQRNMRSIGEIFPRLVPAITAFHRPAALAGTDGVTKLKDSSGLDGSRVDGGIAQEEPPEPRAGNDGFDCGSPQAGPGRPDVRSGTADDAFDRRGANPGHEPLTASRCCHEGRSSPSMARRLRRFGARRQAGNGMQPPGCDRHGRSMKATLSPAPAERLRNAVMGTGRRREKSRRRLFSARPLRRYRRSIRNGISGASAAGIG